MGQVEQFTDIIIGLSNIMVNFKDLLATHDPRRKRAEHYIVCNNKRTYTLTIALTVSLPRKDKYKMRSIEQEVQ